MKYPSGYKRGKTTQIAVRFDTKFFNAIIEMAKKEQPPKDFNAMVVYLAECGKRCLDESDAREPRGG